MVLTKWKIGFFLVLVGSLVWLTNFLNGASDRMYDDFLGKEYNGVIQEIRYIQSHRGFPDILIDGKWIFLSSTEQILFDEIKIGDSIVKNSGSNKIRLYTLDSTLNTKLTEFTVEKAKD